MVMSNGKRGLLCSVRNREEGGSAGGRTGGMAISDATMLPRRRTRGGRLRQARGGPGRARSLQWHKGVTYEEAERNERSASGRKTRQGASKSNEREKVYVDGRG